MTSKLPKLTFWRVVRTLIFMAGLYAAYLRYFLGWQVSTNLTDAQPWGLWVGFRHSLRRRAISRRLRISRSRLSARHGALSPHPARLDPALVPRILHRLHRHAL